MFSLYALYLPVPQETWTVQTLDLTDNNIGTEGARYLAELLTENEFIKQLVLVFPSCRNIIIITVMPIVQNYLQLDFL